MGVARMAMRQGMRPDAAVQAIKRHRDTVQSLDRPQDNAATAEIDTCKALQSQVSDFTRTSLYSRDA